VEHATAHPLCPAVRQHVGAARADPFRRHDVKKS
jgi:hypothetical protein